ncbi:MAG: hypothetical protein OS112_02860 [Methanoregula sp.]|nr:MAG: hypothetical protein OS112_02860 [Methanoregula sp.]
MQEIKSIDIMSWAKIHALFGIVFGLFYGIMFALMGAAVGLSKGMPGFEAFGFLTIVIFPIVFAIFGFICGAIMAFLYNFFAGKMGGIQIELAPK